MMFNWKLSSGFSIFAFVVAVLTGIITGNPFGTIIIRSLIAAVLFGSFGVGVGYVIKKYLPELDFFEAPLPEKKPEASKVDIVVPEENPHLHSDTEGIIEAEDTEFERAEKDGDSESERNGTDADEMGTTEKVNSPEMESVTSEKSNESESLPDIEKLEDTYSSDPGNETTEPTKTETSADKVQVFGSEQDPSVIAQALRTFIKKDQEG